MRSLEQRKGDKIHTRNMEISTYDGGDNHIIVEGQLRDDRLVSTYHHISGKKRPPQNVHHMIVRMCIDWICRNPSWVHKRSTTMVPLLAARLRRASWLKPRQM